MQVLAWNTIEQRSVGQGATDRAYTGEQDIGGVQLHRCVRTVADLTAPRCTGRQGGGEAQAIQADVFGVFNEVAGIARHQQRRQGLQ
ncbi:hypothetical protein D3C76_1321300 [compost metagenome]